MDGSLFGTNLVTMDGADMVANRKLISQSSVQLTTETGPLTYGIWLIAAVGANFWVNTAGGSPAVSDANGVFLKKNNPLFIPIKDPSVIRIISGGSNKSMTFIMF